MRTSRAAATRSVTRSQLGNAQGPFQVEAEFWFQPISFRWANNLKPYNAMCTDPQSLGPINFYLSEGMFKMFIGVYLIMVNDPDILFNDGFYPLLHVVMPEGCLL